MGSGLVLWQHGGGRPSDCHFDGHIGTMDQDDCHFDVRTRQNDSRFDERPAHVKAPWPVMGCGYWHRFCSITES